MAYFGSGLLALAGFTKQFVNTWFLLFGLAATAGVLRLVWTHGRTAHPPAERVRSGAHLGEFLGRNYHLIIAALLAASWVIWWVNLIVDQPQQANAVLLSAAIIVLGSGTTPAAIGTPGNV